MSDETETTSEVARVRPVTEFHVTYFGLSELEADALLDLYADHAYKFAERHKHETPMVGSRSWPTEEAWETPPDQMLQERIDAVINLADQWEVTQQENREALEQRALAPRKTPDPQDFRLAATGCLEVPAVEPPLYRRRTFEQRLGELMGVRRPQAGARPQIATQEPTGGAQGGSAGRGVVGGLGERLRALVAGPHPDVLLVRTAEAVWGDIVDQVDEVEAAYRVADAEIARLSEFHDHYRAQVERVRQVADMAAVLAADMRGTPYERALAGRFDETIRAALDENENEGA